MLLLPTLALAARWDSVPDDTADSFCGSKTPPEGHVTFVGFDRRRDLGAAYGAAEAKLLGASGYVGYRRDALRRRIRDWSKDEIRRGVACVRLLVPRAALDSLDLDGDRFDAALAGRLAAQGPLQLAAPRWSTGCVAHLAELVQERLLGLLPGAIVGHDDPARRTVSLRFAANQQAATLTALVDDASFGGFDFPLDVLALDPEEAGECATNAALGLAADASARSNGLVVSLDLLDHEGQACDGDRDTLVVSTDRPAPVQVFSLAKSGRGNYLGAFDVDGRTVLGSGTWVVSPEPGDERLVAVAGDYAATASWTPGCRLREPWSRAWYGDVAVGTETFLVRPQGGACPALSGASLAARDEAIARRDAAPWCP